LGEGLRFKEDDILCTEESHRKSLAFLSPSLTYIDRLDRHGQTVRVGDEASKAKAVLCLGGRYKRCTSAGRSRQNARTCCRRWWGQVLLYYAVLSDKSSRSREHATTAKPTRYHGKAVVWGCKGINYSPLWYAVVLLVPVRRYLLLPTAHPSRRKERNFGGSGI